MTMVVGEGDPLKDIQDFIKRVNELNDYNLRWEWDKDPDTGIVSGDVSVYDDEFTFVIAPANQVIRTMKLNLNNWGLSDPDN